MKRKNTIYTVLLIGMLTFGACSNWFDVSPKTDIKGGELFETESGFESALAGIYISLTDVEAYGGNLSFGFLDQLAQLYDLQPSSTSDRAEIYNYVENNAYNSKEKLASSWRKAYSIIANVNNLLRWLDVKGQQVILEKEKRDMIRGEALAVRAYLHFDLLRGWGPIYKEEPAMLSIPYRTVADNSKQPLLPANQVVTKVLEDVELARKLLEFESGLSLENFAGKERRFRFNYHAVNALAARVYCYANDPENAVRFAKLVIDNSKLSLQVTNQEDPILFSETLVGVNKYKMSEELSSGFSEGPKFTTQYYLTTTTLNTLFEIAGTDTEDMRAKSSAFFRYNDLRLAISRKYLNNTNGVIPLIRLPEMYYILCEMSPLTESARYINMVRNRRGYSSSTNLTINTEDERVKALAVEYRKEFYAEGQYFYFLKNHAIKNFYNSPYNDFGKQQYVFPLPDAEKEYGWTSSQQG